MAAACGEESAMTIEIERLILSPFLENDASDFVGSARKTAASISALFALSGTKIRYFEALRGF